MKQLPIRLFFLIILVFSLSSFFVFSSSDSDGDGIVDSADVCPDTPTNAVIVNPVDNVDYAGCTCDQIKDLLNFTPGNPCVKFFCFRDKLLLELNSFRGNFTDCPDDYCDGFTLYDFPPDGYSYCQNLTLVPHSCEPSVVPDSPLCGFVHGNNSNVSNNSLVIPDDYVFDSIPIPEGASAYYLSGATLYLDYPEVVLLHSHNSVSAVMVFSGSGRRKAVLSLLSPSGFVINESLVFCGEDLNESVFCYSSWDLPSLIPGLNNFSLLINYSYLGSSLFDSLPVLIFARDPLDDVIVRSHSLIGSDNDFSSFDDSLLSLVLSNLSANGFSVDDISSLKSKVRLVYDNAVVEKSHFVNRDGSTSFFISIIPNDDLVLTNLSLVELIPKSVALNSSLINFSLPPYRVLRDDPLIMWHFDYVHERIDLSYRVDKELVGSEASSASIVFADSVSEYYSPFFITLLMILIPLLVVVFIAFKLFSRKK